MPPLEPLIVTAAQAVSPETRAGAVRLWDDGPLARFAALERRYDGPIPRHLREAALAGDARGIERQRAAAQIQFFGDMARFQIAAIRGRKRSGSDDAGMRRDLRLYLAQRRLWRRLSERMGMDYRPPGAVRGGEGGNGRDMMAAPAKDA